MERPTLVCVSDGDGSALETEVRPPFPRAGWLRDIDIDLLLRRFPGHCPHHLLHNLLQLHYGRHELCTAAPFSVEMCRHGTHAKPVLSPDQVRATAPAAGALLLLPFGLSCRTCDDDSGLVVGCADCELLDDDDVCGGCRRVWNGSCPLPATLFLQAGMRVDLADWQLAVGLGNQMPSSSGPMWQEDWDHTEEEWGEGEWEGEDWSDEWDGDAEDAASWDAGGVWDDGGGGWDGQSGPADDDGGDDSEDDASDWGAGRWVEGRSGNWSLVVDFAPTAASAVRTADAPAHDSAAAAASAATAAVQAVLAAGAAQAAPGPTGGSAAASGVSERIRILELELELERLKRRRLV